MTSQDHANPTRQRGRTILTTLLKRKSSEHSPSLTRRVSASRPLVLHARVVTGTGGGPEKTILNSPRFLKTLGYDCACAYMHPPGDPGFDTLRQRAATLDAEMLSLPDRGATDLSVVRRLLRLCRERQVAVWHGHDHKSNAIGLVLRRFHPMALVSTVHGWIVESRKAALYRQIDLACLGHYDRVICVSDALLDECLVGGVSLDRCRVVENAIDLSQYNSSADQAAARATLGLPRDGHVVVAVGRLSPEKGFDVLIRAADQLMVAGCDLRLLIAGEGHERPVLEDLIQRSGRDERIMLLGHVPDPRTLYAAADAFVLSSHREGLPNVLLEALVCRVPVLATAVGGVPRVIADEQNGLLVNAGDADGLTVALSRLLHNDALKAQLAAAGRRTVEERYSFDARMRKIVAVYDEVMQPGSGLQISNLPSRSESNDDQRSAVVEALALDQVAKLKFEDPTPVTSPPIVTVTAHPRGWNEYLASRGYAGFQQWPEWSQALSRGLDHQSFFIEARQGVRLVGVLPLQLVASRLFGRFLVSLPYVNTAGVVADSDSAATVMVDRAIELADALDVKHLELRHERAVEHPQLICGVTDKVHMRLSLPATSDELWNGIKAKVRNQIRKAQKTDGFTVQWGRAELLSEFYDIFCHNMRDLGTPPFSRRLFAEILKAFPNVEQVSNLPNQRPDGQVENLPHATAEICVVRLHDRPVASGLLIHGPGTTQVPSASSLREFNSSNCNMLLYWNLLTRAIERGQAEFDFGRSTRDGGTYKFKAQWGAVEQPAVWQHYVRHGSASDMRPSNSKFQKVIQIWQRLPVWFTRSVGPSIVRGIP